LSSGFLGYSDFSWPRARFAADFSVVTYFH
jgi:hypothetical protein